MDKDGTGTLSLDEMIEALQNMQVSSLAELGLSPCLKIPTDDPDLIRCVTLQKKVGRGRREEERHRRGGDQGDRQGHGLRWRR